MNPSDPTQTTPDSSTETWFESLPNAPQAAPISPTPSRPESTPRKRPVITIAIIIVVVVCLGGGAALLFMLSSATPAVGKCLTNDDYVALTDHSIDDAVSPSEGFFTAPLKFKNGTSEALATAATSNRTAIDTVADFYAKHSDASIIITVTGDYNGDVDTAKAAEERVDAIKTTLQTSGVPSSLVKTSTPSKFTSDGELPANSEELAAATVYLTITSDERCSDR